MSFDFRPAKRENVPLFLSVAGGTGSGKTMSALRVARGIADGKPFAALDTENKRMLIYADEFPEMMHASIDAPFRPAKYTEGIDAADAFLAAQGVPVQNRVIVVDSASHEWYGDGGCLDWHDELMGGNQAKNLSAWIEPKRAHKAMVSRLLRVEAHVILCFRAEPKVEAVRRDGRVEIVPKQSLTGLDGWIPIAEKNLPFEATASFLCMADQPGVPKPIKLPEKLRPLVPLDKPLDETVGKQLAAWAAGGSAAARPRAARSSQPADETDGLTGDEFKQRIHGVDKETVNATGRELFPGRKPSELTNADRLAHWQAIERRLRGENEGPGLAGAEASPFQAPAGALAQ